MEKIIDILRKIPDWNDLLKLPKKVAELEARIKALEDGESVLLDPCPKCKKPAFELISSSKHQSLGRLGVMNRLYRCSLCNFEEVVVHSPK